MVDQNQTVVLYIHILSPSINMSSCMKLPQHLLCDLLHHQLPDHTGSSNAHLIDLFHLFYSPSSHNVTPDTSNSLHTT